MDRSIIQAKPFMPVPDLEEALAFMTGMLGFAAIVREPGYAYASREGAGLRILQAGPGNPIQPAGDVHGPADKSYGQRELLVLAPDGNLTAFGEALERATR